MTTSEEFLVGLRRIIRATDRHAKTVSRGAGMTPSQLLVLQTITRQNSATIGGLAREMNLSQATVTTLVDRLEARGFVRRERNNLDRRKIDVFPTEQGLVVLNAGFTRYQEKIAKGFEALESWEQGQILATLARIASLMEAKDLDASPVLDVGEIDRPIDTQALPADQDQKTPIKA